MIQKINEKQNILGDNIGFVEQWDFSKANLNEENRIKAITTVASICYQNPKAVGSESLYNRLMAESMGLPSSSFEFVPVLFDYLWVHNYFNMKSDLTLIDSNTLKYGEFIYVDDNEYLLTNYRALVYDVENMNLNKDILKHFNTQEECEIIKQHFKVFLYKVDLPTRSQMVRHRLSWQELSRRYVSAKRVPFEFYVSEKLKGFSAEIGEESYDADPIKTSINDLIEYNENMYYALLDAGVKPQEARRIIPQAAYT